MKAPAAVIAVGACLALSGGPLAQTAPAPSLAITPEQRAAIRQHVADEKRPSIPAPQGFKALVGATLPDSIEVFWMPRGAGVSRYRYTVVGDQAVILEYQNRRVIEILK